MLYKLSASTAHRWMRCTKSLELELLCPETEKNSDQNTGIEIHELAAKALRAGLYEVVSEYQEYDQVQTANKYIEYVNNIPADFRLYETKIRFDGNTYYIDALLYDTDTQHMHIVDLKTGRNEVKAKDNEQLYFYALGAYAFIRDILGFLDIKSITLHIVQPTINNYDSHDLENPFIDLESFYARYEAISRKVITNELEFNPLPEACHYCSAKAVCPALAEQSLEVLAEENTLSIKFKDINALSLDEIARVLPFKKQIEDWCTAVYAYALNKAKAGEAVPGHKLVRGRNGNARWVDEQLATAYFKKCRLKDDAIYKKALISPTQALKLDQLKKGQKDKLAELIERPEGGILLVGEEDKRDALSFNSSASSVDDFDIE